MKSTKILEAFEKALCARKTALADLTPEQGIAAMLGFYRDVRIEDCRDLADDGDMLLYQWGTYEREGGECFELDLTRQLIAPDEAEDDGAIWQLSLTFSFARDSELEALGEGNDWCHAPVELVQFEAALRASKPFRAAIARRPSRVELDFEDAE